MATQKEGRITEENLQKIAKVLAGKAGFKYPLRIDPIKSGRNNRVYKLIIEKEIFLLKHYFQHENDQRDRLKTEYSFISFVWNHGLRVIPRPIAFNQSASFGVYEFVEGKRLHPGEISPQFVQQALDFFLRLNRLTKNPAANKLNAASESCFNINDHISCVESRLQRLSLIKTEDTFSYNAIDFINNELYPVWLKEKDKLLNQAKKLNWDLSKPFPYGEMCLSPSDFGFHNVILENDGNLRFIDFEYAGWDDPAKTICDFFCQPSVPVPFHYFPNFQDIIASEYSYQTNIIDRIILVFPTHYLKWCCIMLNEFLPVGDNRRKFAGYESRNQRRKIQVEKARSYLNNFLYNKISQK